MARVDDVKGLGGQLTLLIWIKFESKSRWKIDTKVYFLPEIKKQNRQRRWGKGVCKLFRHPVPIFSAHFFDQTSFLMRADVAKKGRVALGHSTHLLVVNCEDLATAQCPASQHPQRNQDHAFCLLCKWAQPVFNDTKWDSSPAVIAFPLKPTASFKWTAGKHNT